MGHGSTIMLQNEIPGYGMEASDIASQNEIQNSTITGMCRGQFWNSANRWTLNSIHYSEMLRYQLEKTIRIRCQWLLSKGVTICPLFFFTVYTSTFCRLVFGGPYECSVSGIFWANLESLLLVLMSWICCYIKFWRFSHFGPYIFMAFLTKLMYTVVYLCITVTESVRWNGFL
jgi:hypothetical protein